MLLAPKVLILLFFLSPFMFACGKTHCVNPNLPASSTLFSAIVTALISPAKPTSPKTKVYGSTTLSLKLEAIDNITDASSAGSTELLIR